MIAASCYRYYPAILFVAFLFLGTIVYDDYGISWDEHTQRITGLVSYDYVFNGQSELHTWKDRDYGVAFELPLIFVEKLLNLSSAKDIFLLRHFFTHLFFLFTVIVFFLLIKELFHSPLLGMLGAFIYALHPRLYAHSFFNTKDIPFMGMFVVCFYSIYLAFKKDRLLYFFYAGLSVGILINIRIMGVLLFVLVPFFLGLDFIKLKNRTPIIQSSLFIIGAVISLYLTWPFLWEDPIRNFLYAFNNMRHFRWDSYVLFGGEMFHSVDLPWSYALKWFILTTPILYLALGGIGIFCLGKDLISSLPKFLYDLKGRSYLIYLVCLVVPFISVIILNSVLYDDWRQLYFIYPSFVLLSIYGLSKGFKTKIKNVLFIIIGIMFVLVLSRMWEIHPYEHVYFNEFVNHHQTEYIREHYEMDYWGTSYKESLAFILSHDPREEIKVLVANPPGITNALFLFSEVDGQNRLVVTLDPSEKSDYFVTNYRWHPEDYTTLKEREIYSVRIGNNTINSVFALNDGILRFY